MKQRLAIALAVMHDPELLILDEPINGLDPIGIAEVRSFIRELCDARGKTILISSHILSEISLLADDIGIIDHGALLEEERCSPEKCITKVRLRTILLSRNRKAYCWLLRVALYWQTLMLSTTALLLVAVGLNEADFRRGQNLGKTLAGE